MVLEKENVIALFSALKTTMTAERDALIELDSIMGDGDLGLTMAAAFSAALEDVEKSDEDDLGKLLMKAGMAMAKAAPSTMGTLMGTGFMRGGKALKEKTSLESADMAAFWTGFVEGLMERGKAKPGDKTIIDSLYPASVALKEAASAGQEMKEAFVLALAAAEKGLEDSKDLIAQFGRAAYYQEKSRGKQDPGATVGVLLIKTFCDYLKTF